MNKTRLPPEGMEALFSEGFNEDMWILILFETTHFEWKKQTQGFGNKGHVWAYPESIHNSQYLTWQQCSSMPYEVANTFKNWAGELHPSWALAKHRAIPMRELTNNENIVIYRRRTNCFHLHDKVASRSGKESMTWQNDTSLDVFFS